MQTEKVPLLIFENKTTSSMAAQAKDFIGVLKEFSSMV